MKRDIEQRLLEWKQSENRKPLIIRGARQVGKTYTITAFGDRHYDSCIKLDFEKDLSLMRVFEGNLSPEKIILELELFFNTKIIPGKTLLFMDEIQQCERALLALRYFYEEMPELHVIAAGSMLEFALSDISFPVGRVSFEWMYPMTFREFLIASDKAILAESIPSISDYKPVTDFAHDMITEQLRIYFITGGMPEAVNEYIQSNSLAKISQIHEEIFYSYLQSLTKYSNRIDVESLNHVMRTIPKYVGNQIRYSTIDPDRRVEKTKSSLQILEKALVIHRINAAGAGGLPLGADYSSKVFKSLFLDIGLLQYACGIDANSIINEKDLSRIYKGALVEQFVGQELLASGGSEGRRLYYWSRMKKNSSAEVDYLIVKAGKIYPVEVKSGPAGKLKSMHLYLSEVNNADLGYVLSPTSHTKQLVSNLLFMPFYTRLN